MKFIKVNDTHYVNVELVTEVIAGDDSVTLYFQTTDVESQSTTMFNGDDAKRVISIIEFFSRNSTPL